jgi:uncharacterized LabA/DUF88 family protein
LEKKRKRDEIMEDKRFAILIDADNVSAKYITYILDEISNYGVATYKRIYGDWTKKNTSSWKEVLLDHSITPIQQYNYTTGKNATDSAMIIDAMDILYSKNVEGFCIVSSDSDFTKLSSRLRESGMFVIGMGEKKTPKPFIASCNLFKYLDVLEQAQILTISEERSKIEEDISDIKKIEKNMTDINIIGSAILKIINENADETQGVNMGELGSRLSKRYPDFDVRNYGDSKFSKFLRKFDYLQIQTYGNSTSLWVNLKKEVTQDFESYDVKKKTYSRRKSSI